ncbi:MAG TPA: phasin family protein [Methylocella sp.]|nr:phasin family protein [Methylocella sp.]
MAEIRQEVAVAAEDVAVTAEEDSAALSVAELPAEPPAGSASILEEPVAECGLDLVAGLTEAALAEDFEVLEELSEEGLRTAKSLAGPFLEAFDLFATETLDYSRTCLENRTALAGALLRAKTLTSAAEIQTSYMKFAYANFFAHLMKMSALSLQCLGEAAKPAQP